MAEGLAALVAADARRYRAYLEERFGYRPLTWFLDPGFVCALLHRIAHALHRRGARKVSRLVMQLNSIVSGADIEPSSRLGPGLLIPHPCGATISGAAGANLTVGGRAGCGGSVQSRDVGAGAGLPVLGNDVRLGEFSGSQGGIRIDDGAVIEGGAGALVDIPQGGRGVLASMPITDAEVPAEPCPAAPPQCTHRRWSVCWRDWQADVDRSCAELERYVGSGSSRLRRLSVMLTNPLLALFVHRLSHWLYVNGHRRGARLLRALNAALHKLVLTPRSCLGGGVLMPHLAAVVVDGSAGRDLVIYANCVLMPLGKSSPPVVGERLALGGHAGIVGSVSAGDDVHLAPKVQLLADAPSGAQAFSPMSRVKRIEPGEHRHRPPHQAEEPPQFTSWRDFRAYRRADQRRVCEQFGAPSLASRSCVFMFRLSQLMLARGHRRLSRALWRFNLRHNGCDLAPDSRVGPGLAIPHPAGISLYGIAGRNLTLHAQTCFAAEIDAPLPRSLTQAPLLGDDVVLEPHSSAFGPVRIGSGARLRPGCVVRNDIEAGATVSPRPLKVRLGPTLAASAKR